MTSQELSRAINCWALAIRDKIINPDDSKSIEDRVQFCAMTCRLSKEVMDEAAKCFDWDEVMTQIKASN